MKHVFAAMGPIGDMTVRSVEVEQAAIGSTMKALRRNFEFAEPSQVDTGYAGRTVREVHASSMFVTRPTQVPMPIKIQLPMNGCRIGHSRTLGRKLT